jgi:predicted O-linked N-acetylglucosamine transferase (SPINDLY family)
MSVDGMLARGESLPPFDCHIPLLSLPRVLHTTLATIPTTMPYLRVPAARVAQWQPRLSGKGLRVGLTWAGNPNVKNDHWRSPRLQPLLPLLDTPGVTFYSIQMGDGRRDLAACGDLPPHFVDLGADIRDFADTAAILSQLDLLITSDTSAAHLAGALGCKTWVILHAVPDWRWMPQRSDSPWYPTLSLYRQTVLGQWQEVVQAVSADLNQLAQCVDTNRIVSAQPYADISAYNRLYAEGESFLLTDLAAAQRCFEQCVKIAPSDAKGWESLANVHYSLANIGLARTCFEKTLELCPGTARLWVNLALLRLQEHQPEQAHVLLRKAQDLEPMNRDMFSVIFCKAHSNFVSNTSYDPNLSRAAIFEAHRQWNEYNRLPMQTAYGFMHRTHRCKLRIGLVSADLYSHPVGILISGLLEHVDGDRFEIYCFAEERNNDSMTECLRNQATVWRNVTTLSDEQLADCVYKDEIDVLVDLSGHTAGNRLRAFTRKPAPVQMSFLGYWETTGIPEMDYVISDDYSVLPEDEPYFVERVLRLPYSRFCYRPPSFAPDIRLKDKGEPIVFGCFNNDKKLNLHVMRLWADILQAVPNAKLLLKWRGYEKISKQQEIIEQFAQCGVEQSTVLFEGFSTYDVLLNKYNAIDIALDPFPFSGGLTTCDAMWMGVPVVTMMGNRPIGRQSAALLEVLGYTDLIAQDEAQYCAIAVNLAQNKERLMYYKQTLRQVMMTSPLMDAVSYTRKLENLLLSIC